MARRLYSCWAHGTAEVGSPFQMQVSLLILFISYRLSTMSSVVSEDIFLWPPVSTYKSQQFCQNSRTVSAKGICKVSSWVIASSGASKHPAISCCFWPLSATQSFSFFFFFFKAVLKISLIARQPTIIINIQMNARPSPTTK